MKYCRIRWILFCFLIVRLLPISTLFPYTTLFRSNDYSVCIPTFCPACQEFENELATNPNATPSNPAIIDTCLSGCCEDPAIQKQYLGGISYGGPYPNIAAYASQSTPNTGGPTPVVPTKSKKPKFKLEEQVIKRLQKLANIKN